MAGTFDAKTADPIIAMLLSISCDTSARVNATIHPDDQMIRFEIEHQQRDLHDSLLSYFSVGMHIHDALRQIVTWRFGGFDGVSALLDFAAGYGRSTRFLVQEMPAQRVWVSEILADAVAFQHNQFGVHGILSTAKPEAFSCAQRFDCIVVISLFSHLPERTFTRWLRRLYDLLTNDGLLIFSVHDMALLPPGTMPESGFYYLETSENDVLDVQDYGAAFVSEDFVRNAIEQVTTHTSYQRIAKGIAHRQDLYIVPRNPGRDFDNFTFDYGPQGCLDAATLTSGEHLVLAGWAADLAPDTFIADVQCFVNGQLCQRTMPCLDRPDVAQYLGDIQRKAFIVSGWRCECALPEGFKPSDILIVKAISDQGMAQFLFCDTIEKALLLSLPKSGSGHEEVD